MVKQAVDLLRFFTFLRLCSFLYVRCSLPKLKHSVLNTLPVLYWLPKYSFWDYGMPDLVSGISVGIMHLPQGKITLYSCIKSLLIWRILVTKVLKSNIMHLVGYRREKDNISKRRKCLVGDVAQW